VVVAVVAAVLAHGWLLLVSRRAVLLPLGGCGRKATFWRCSVVWDCGVWEAE
jgi:hypothetical protein